MTSAATPVRGRPRSERARLAVLDAAADLLLDGGLSAATIEAIAARAGVSKVTIYKWWPSRGAVAIDAYFHRVKETIAFQDTGQVACDLIIQMRTMIDALQGRSGAVLAELIGRAQSDPQLAEMLRTRWLAPRRAATASVIQRAIDRGELAPDTDVPMLMDKLYGPLYFRLLMQHEPLEPVIAERLVRSVLDGVRATGDVPRQRTGADLNR